MSAFDAAAALLFGDPNLAVAAIYREAGTGAPVPINVIAEEPDQLSRFNEGRFVSDSLIVHIRIAEAPNLQAEDTLEIGATVFVVQGSPVRDSLLILWRAEARPQ